MKYNTLVSQSGNDPVRLLGVGATGMRLVEQLKYGALGPLADLWRAPLVTSSDRSATRLAAEYPLAGAAIVFVATAWGATREERAFTQSLLERAREAAIPVIGVVMPSERPSSLIRSTAPQDWLAHSVSGLIDLEAHPSDDDLNALRWFYGAFFNLAREGFLLLEPAWDLVDIEEVLDFPGAQLTLVTQAVPKGVELLCAVDQALDALIHKRVDLDAVSGVLAVVWQSPGPKLKVHQVSRISRHLRASMGPGVLHLILVARAKVGWDHVGACATLIAGVRPDNRRWS